MERYQSVILSSDFVFVNSIPYFITISHHIKFITYLMTKYQGIKPVIETIKKVEAHYAKHGFRIEGVRMDRQFGLACVKLDLLYIGINTISKGKYVPDIDQLKLTIKERVLTTYNYINRHLTKLAGVFIREMVYAEVFWINRFPDADGVFDTISHQKILTLLKLHLSHHCILKFE